MNIDGSEQRKLASGGCCFKWSPDGSQIAYISWKERELWVVRRDGSGLRKLASLPGFASAAEPTWSPDGKQIAFSRGWRGAMAIYVVNSDGSGLARLSTPRNGVGDDGPVWSPDGTRIVFERDGNYLEASVLVVMNTDGTGQHRLTPSVYGAAASWSPDGRRLAFQGIEGRGWDIWVVNADGSGLKNLTHTKAPWDSRPRWSPTSNVLVFESKTRSRNGVDVHSITVEGTRHRNLTHSPKFDGEPEWSPDGQTIVFSSNRGPEVKTWSNIYVMPAPGRQPTNLTNTTKYTANRFAQWSPGA